MKADDPMVRDVIRRTMVARIATLSGNGRPSVTPLYFVWLNDHIWLGTVDWTLAARDAKANPHVSLLFAVEQGYDQRILRVTGRAIVRSDPNIQRAYVLRVAFKYVLTPAGLRHRLTHLGLQRFMKRYHAQSAEKGQSCIIDVTPEQAEFV